MKECDTRFKKLCYFEYEFVSRSRVIEVCSRKKARDCDQVGEVRCSTELEMG